MIRLVQFIEVPTHLTGVEKSLRDLGLVPAGFGADITVTRYRIPDGTDAATAYVLAAEVVEGAEKALDEAAERRSTLTPTMTRDEPVIEVALRKNGLIGRVVKRIDRTVSGRQVPHYVIAFGTKLDTVPVSETKSII